jgi:GNAT superfamily N-acetyltransferase
MSAEDKLIPARMQEADVSRADVQAFHCGSRPHEIPLAEWIKHKSAEQISRGTKVWLYERKAEDGQRQLVGYGSLSKYKITTTEPDGSEKRIKVLEIPMLAVHEDFQGCPKNVADPEEKYSRQIVRHLQREARGDLSRGKGIEPLLTLYVHQDAEPAQKLYLSCGFVFVPRTFPDPKTGATLRGMDFTLQ